MTELVRTTPTLSPCGRYYVTPDGNLPRVSSVLATLGKPWLEKWEARLEREAVTEAAVAIYEDTLANRVSSLSFSMMLQARIGPERAAERVKNKALDVGGKVHKLIEWEMRRELGIKVKKAPALDGEAANAFEQFRAWRESVHLAPLAVELPVWHKEDGHAGTLDLLSRVDGEVAVVDFKTSGSIYPDYCMQTAAYVAAANVMGVTPEPVTRGFIVRLPKRAGDGFEVHEVENIASDYRAFVNLLSVWRWVQGKRPVSAQAGEPPCKSAHGPDATSPAGL